MSSFYLRFSTPVVAVSAILAMTACSPAPDAPVEVTNGSGSAQQPASSAPTDSLGLGIDLQNLDASVRPQDDFYRYVNGGWVDRTTIPADRSRWGSFDELREAAEQHVL